MAAYNIDVEPHGEKGAQVVITVAGEASDHWDELDKLGIHRKFSNPGTEIEKIKDALCHRFSSKIAKADIDISGTSRKNPVPAGLVQVSISSPRWKSASDQEVNDMRQLVKNKVSEALGFQTVQMVGQAR